MTCRKGRLKRTNRSHSHSYRQLTFCTYTSLISRFLYACKCTFGATWPILCRCDVKATKSKRILTRVCLTVQITHSPNLRAFEAWIIFTLVGTCRLYEDRFAISHAPNISDTKTLVHYNRLNASSDPHPAIVYSCFKLLFQYHYKQSSTPR